MFLVDADGRPIIQPQQGLLRSGYPVVGITAEEGARLLEMATAKEELRKADCRYQRTGDSRAANSSIATSVIGAIGELALHKHYGLEYQYPVHCGADPGYDIELPLHLTGEIKTNTYYDADLRLVQPRLRASLAVLCVPISEDQIELTGWCGWRTFLRLQEERNYGYGIRYVVHWSRLRLMGELDAILSKGKT